MHNHNVIDTDIHYKIDGVSRTVTNINETKRMLVQGDHNSERLTFEIPRYVDGHDFSECNAVQIHYENTDMSEKNRSADIYDVNDLHVKEDDEDIVVLSWLVHNNATKYIGTLNFGIRFSCIAEDGVVEYAWNTTTFKGISILPGLYNSEHIAEYNSDAIASLSARIVGEKTTGHGEIFNDYENNKALSKFSKASGHKTIAASKCFLFDLTHKYTSADYNTNGEGRYYLTDVTGIEPGFEYSVVLTNNYDLNGTVLSVGENYIEVDNYKKPDNISEIITESSYIFFPYHSDLGTDTIGTGAQAEGYETFALAIASHAEGCETIAAGKQSHVEGKGTIAAYAGHAEGLETKALGLGNHAEGSGSITGGTWGSHAEGFETEAKGGYGCHSEGFRTKALASHGSHAEGYR